MADVAPGPVDRHIQNEALRIIYAFEAVAVVFIILRIWSRCLLQRGSWSGLMMWSKFFQIPLIEMIADIFR